MVRVWIGALLSLALAGEAAAGPSIERGGPKARSDRARLARAVDKVAGVLGVCWRGDRPASVTVEVSVEKSGAVRRARAKTRGKVAECAAAVLAVQTLTPAKRGYEATLSFPTRGGGTAAASVRDTVNRGVKRHEAIAACTRKASDASGRIDIRFLVKRSGRIVDVEVVRDTVEDRALAACLVAAIESIRLSKLDTNKTVEFVMPFAFSGGGGGSSEGRSSGAALRPTKKGPIPTGELSRVMNAARAKFTACYDRRARKKPGLAGDVVLRYTVRANGTTRNVKIKRTTLNDRAVEQCMVRVGEKLRFSSERGRKETRVVYPFRFARER